MYLKKLIISTQLIYPNLYQTKTFVLIQTHTVSIHRIFPSTYLFSHYILHQKLSHLYTHISTHIKMRPTPSSPPPSPSNSAFFWNLHSPLPYLFGGLTLMLLLIATALVILACSCKNRFSDRTDSDDQKAAQPYTTAAVADASPKMVVIMAGDDKPTHLAIPVPCDHFSKSCVDVK